MNTLLIGNGISLIGCLVMVSIGFLKKKSQILAAQCVQCGFMGLGNLILGGVSGFVCNMVTILRNLIFVKFQPTVALKLFFIGLQVLLSLGSLTGGLISWLPILAAALFTWFMDTHSETTMKIIIISTLVMWLIYDLYYCNYVATGFDIMSISSNLIGLVLVIKQK